MKVTFILPCVGKKGGDAYVKSWLMEPLSVAVLSALTPPDVDRAFYDDRLESIPYDEPTNLVAISIETYSARRGYQIAAEFRRRNVPVVVGGFHATHMPDEAGQHADSVVVGAAEKIWPGLLRDAAAGKLAPRYTADGNEFVPVLPDRTIFAGKRYMAVTLIETGRGCSFNCEFCSISTFYKKKYYSRPIPDVVREIRETGARNIFFIDDNIMVDKARTRELLHALMPLGIRWMGQVSLNLARDDKMLKLMKQSGCMGVLIGFESLNPRSLKAMGKDVNLVMNDYEAALNTLNRHRLAVYGTFVFGYDEDDEQAFEDTYRFAVKHGMFFTAFNHLVPFPGTPLYHRIKEEGRLLHNAWWLEKGYRFGDIAFRPAGMQAGELAERCLKYRLKFYALPSVLKRAMNIRTNCGTLFMALLYFVQNFSSRRDIRRRQGLPLGVHDRL